MIHFSFNINNPFHTLSNTNVTNYIVKNWRLSKNKSFEFQLCRAGSIYNLFGIELDTRIKGRHHAGINFDLDLCGYVLILNLIDNRHWDFEHGTWDE